MNEEIKNQMLLNSESYEFFLKETREAEKNFFRYSALCIKEIERANDAFEETQDELYYSRINIKKFKAAYDAGKQFLTTSKKFITEMEMMKELAGNIFDPDLNMGEAERFKIHESYLETIDKSIDLQNRVTGLIVMEMNGLKDFQEGKQWEDSDDDEWKDGGGIL